MFTDFHIWHSGIDGIVIRTSTVALRIAATFGMVFGGVLLLQLLPVPHPHPLPLLQLLRPLPTQKSAQSPRQPRVKLATYLLRCEVASRWRGHPLLSIVCALALGSRCILLGSLLEHFRIISASNLCIVGQSLLQLSLPAFQT